MDVYFDRIKPLFVSTGLTIRQLAPLIGIPEKTIYNWENGVKSYSKYYFQISKYFNVSIEYLKGETDEKLPPSEKKDGIGERISRLSPTFQEKLVRFLELAQANPESAERFLSFAVQELQSSQQGS